MDTLLYMICLVGCSLEEKYIKDTADPSDGWTCCPVEELLRLSSSPYSQPLTAMRPLMMHVVVIVSCCKQKHVRLRVVLRRETPCKESRQLVPRVQEGEPMCHEVPVSRGAFGRRTSRHHRLVQQRLHGHDMASHSTAGSCVRFHIIIIIIIIIFVYL